MKDYTGICVAPHYERDENGYRITGWKYDALKNGRLITFGSGYDTPKEAREAGRKATEEV